MSGPPGGVRLRAVADDEWPVAERLWQLFRHDLTAVVDGWPYPDGRYRAHVLAGAPRPGLAAWLGWRPHPRTGQAAPVALAVVTTDAEGLRTMDGFWVAPRLRGAGVGAMLAAAVLDAAPGAWRIGFQHENTAATALWRAVAVRALEPGWREVRVPVPARAVAPDDHVILGRTRSAPHGVAAGPPGP